MDPLPRLNEVLQYCFLQKFYTPSQDFSFLWRIMDLGGVFCEKTNLYGTNNFIHSP